ncbi:MAG: hypothetical protein JO051_05365 [Acidobacteriaceae bacterium]|nr:hypothetical protein [Acidobacteriaceae bacterium]
MKKALIISAFCCASCALGQTAATSTSKMVLRMADTAEFGPVGITTALAGPMSTVTGAPYSAESTTERVQMLADGNRIIQSTSGTVARDGQGRMHREESLPGLKTSGGDAPHIVMIDDPVAQVHWTLDAQNKIAIKMPIPNVKAGSMGVVAGSGISSATKNFFYISGPTPVGPSATIIRNGDAANDPNTTTTNLGTHIIEGVSAQGTRVTRTIPAGQFGNEQPMIITTESWYSPDLKVLVMSKSSDPRMGDTTYTLTNIQRSEPPPSLFQVPSDYTVKEPGTAQVQIQTSH